MVTLGKTRERAARWTRFMDMHSGGGSKERWGYIYIEAPEAAARVIFYNRFGHDPSRVTCTCCGSDYSVGEDTSLEQATAFDRNCEWDDATKRYAERPRTEGYGAGSPYVSLDAYLATGAVLVIRAAAIGDEERHGEIPASGWVWVE